MTGTVDDIESFTGDAAGAAILRNSLRQLASLEVGTRLAVRIDDVLAGRRSMRELAEHPHLVEFAHRGISVFDEAI